MPIYSDLFMYILYRDNQMNNIKNIYTRPSGELRNAEEDTTLRASGSRFFGLRTDNDGSDSLFQVSRDPTEYLLTGNAGGEKCQPGDNDQTPLLPAGVPGEYIHAIPILQLDTVESDDDVDILSELVAPPPTRSNSPRVVEEV